MSYYDPDAYNQPEKFGLTVVGEVEWYEPCYSFDTTVVWRHSNGTLYWASDSGCSCPSPFEDYNTLESLETGTHHELIAYLTARLNQYEPTAYGAADVAELILKVRNG